MFEQVTEEAAKRQLDKLLNRPLSFQEKLSSFRESLQFREHGIEGQKWGVHKTKSHNYDYEKSPSEGLAGGYWRHSSVKGKIFLALEKANGEWVKISDLKKEHVGNLKAGEVGIDRKIGAIKRWGQNTGRWSVEVSGDEVRLFMATRTSGIKPVSNEKLDSDSKFATKLAKDYIEAQELSHGDVYWKKSSEMLNKYCSDMGVSKGSYQAFSGAIDSWKGSVNENDAQALRAVAMKYYGRSPKDEYTDGDSNLSKLYFNNDTLSGKASKMESAALAMKAYAGAYAKAKGITVLYRGVDGDIAHDIQESLKSGNEAKLAVNSLSSWSESKSRARLFGSVVLKLKVDTDNIWLVHSSGAGIDDDEKEVIVGHHKPFETFKKSDVELS